jgi:tRNA(Ile)-lysidine synthase
VDRENNIADVAVRSALALCPPTGVILTAVSGGLDSMVLLNSLHRLVPERIHVVHYNHQLRGSESDLDAEFVRDFCGHHQIPLTIGTGRVAEVAAEQKISVEMAARQERYSFFSKAGNQLGASAVFLGHHADDQVETYLQPKNRI